MNFFSLKKIKHLILFLLLLSGSLATVNAEKFKQIIPGWVEVSFNIDEKYISLNKGKLDESYDEFVGELIDNGLLINKSHWIKPTYGNQNLLWTLNSKIGKEKIRKIETSKDQFSSSEYTFSNGELIIKGEKWNYSGYSINIKPSNSEKFKSYILSCEKNNGISVFYWGNDSINLLKNNSSIMSLLKILSKQC